MLRVGKVPEQSGLDHEVESAPIKPPATPQKMIELAACAGIPRRRACASAKDVRVMQ